MKEVKEWDSMMKLVVLASAACALLTASAQSQGTVVFGNEVDFLTEADRFVYADHVGGTLLVGTQFRAQLYAGPADAAASALNPAGASSPFRIPNTLHPGTWVFGSRLVPASVGETVTLQIRVWDDSAAGSWEDASAMGGVFVAASAPFAYTVPQVGSPPFAFFMENMRAFAPGTDFDAGVVPEPTWLGLVALLSICLSLKKRKALPR